MLLGINLYNYEN